MSRKCVSTKFFFVVNRLFRVKNKRPFVCSDTHVVTVWVGFGSVDKRVSQILNGHTGTFATIKIPGRVEPAQVGLFLFCFGVKDFCMISKFSLFFFFERVK